MINIGKTRISFLIGFALFLQVWLVYNEIPTFSFVSFDDPEYILENSNIRKGLTLSGVVWALTSFSACNWHPVTWLSHMLDCSLFGMNPGGHHWTNLLLHIFNSIALFMILLRMTGATWRSAFVASLFAVHPLHVESVAWVAERKDLLSAFLAFLTIGTYLSYVREKGKGYYRAAVLLFAAGLAAKPMLVTIPFVLILLDYWPLKRRIMTDGRQFLSQLREKAPFFILALLSSIITLFAQQDAMYTRDAIPLTARFGNAAVSYIEYLFKTFWPLKLACFYPFPNSLEAGAVVLSIVVLIAVTLTAVKFRKTAPYILVGWFWFLGTLVPVIGIVKVGSQALADRYTYIPLIGIFIILAWGAETVGRRFKNGYVAAICGGLLVISLLSILAHQQCSFWKNSKALYNRALVVTSGNYAVHCNLGVVYAKEGDFDRAEMHFREALYICPGYSKAIYNLGGVHELRQNWDEAIFYYKEFLKIEGNWDVRLSANAQINIAMALSKKGELIEAESIIKKVLSSESESAKAHNHYAIILFNQGRLEDAREQFEKALSLETENRDYAFNVQKIKQEIAKSQNQ